jgi:hypothetical protein
LPKPPPSLTQRDENGVQTVSHRTDDPKTDPPAVAPAPPGSTGPIIPQVMPSGRPLPPNIRQTPTVAGEILNLGPNENATEKAVEFAHKLFVCEVENKLLVGRLKKVEADLEARERSLQETTGEVEQASAEIVRSRGELTTLRKEVAELKNRLKQSDQEDVETLRSVISALEKLLEAPRKKD